MIRSVIFSIIFVILALSNASASVSTRTYASIDGIGYRSNMIDPLNHYSSSQEKMFISLLQRYRLLSGNTDGSKYTSSYKKSGDENDYIARAQEMLSSKDKLLSVSKYHYAYGICGTNNYSTALVFMDAAVQTLGNTSDTDRLIVARHRMLDICDVELTELTGFLDEINTILVPLREKRLYGPWVAYLDGAMYFYEEEFEKATAKFTSIQGNNSGWLKDTADYMAVRISREIVKSFHIPYQSFKFNLRKYLKDKSPSLTQKFDQAISSLQASMVQYLIDHTKGRYVDTVRNLNSYVFWINGDRNALAAFTHREFVRIIASRLPVSIKQKMYFLGEATISTKAIFEFPRKSEKEFYVHPLAIVSGLLFDVSNHSPPQYPHSSDAWLSRYNNNIEVGVSFPGLSAYFDLLLLAHDEKLKILAHERISREKFGPLYPDALILKARALEMSDNHLDAANLWIQISTEYPLYNALTEVATAYVRAGQFVEFSRLKKTWMTDLAPEDLEDQEWYHDEFSVDVKYFYTKLQPYRNLLRAGFETMVSPEEAVSVYADTTLNPIIRFLAAEPILRDSLLNGKYSKFIKIAKHVFDSQFDARLLESDRENDSDLITAYRGLLPNIQALVRNPGDPDALTVLGYFIYSKNRFPKCYERTTLWERSFNICADEQFEKYFHDQARPIDLLSKALAIYKSQPIRTPGEARVLRILIYCFKGNEYDCVRDREDVYTKSVRKGYFQRLHKYFPEAAKRTPYWY